MDGREGRGLLRRWPEAWRRQECSWTDLLADLQCWPFGANGSAQDCLSHGERIPLSKLSMAVEQRQPVITRGRFPIRLWGCGGASACTVCSSCRTRVCELPDRHEGDGSTLAVHRGEAIPSVGMMGHSTQEDWLEQRDLRREAGAWDPVSFLCHVLLNTYVMVFAGVDARLQYRYGSSSNSSLS